MITLPRLSAVRRSKVFHSEDTCLSLSISVYLSNIVVTFQSQRKVTKIFIQHDRVQKCFSCCDINLSIYIYICPHNHPYIHPNIHPYIRPPPFTIHQSIFIHQCIPSIHTSIWPLCPGLWGFPYEYVTFDQQMAPFMKLVVDHPSYRCPGFKDFTLLTNLPDSFIIISFAAFLMQQILLQISNKKCHS